MPCPACKIIIDSGAAVAARGGSDADVFATMAEKTAEILQHHEWLMEGLLPRLDALQKADIAFLKSRRNEENAARTAVLAYIDALSE